jgi:hypothetical protein
MTDKIAILSDVERRLATVQTVDEAKDIRDKAEAIRIYAKSAKKGLAIQNRAACIKILAERRAGELLRERQLKPGPKAIPDRLSAILSTKTDASAQALSSNPTGGGTADKERNAPASAATDRGLGSTPQPDERSRA